jgi:hypothetical protein
LELTNIYYTGLVLGNLQLLKRLEEINRILSPTENG